MVKNLSNKVIIGFFNGIVILLPLVMTVAIVRFMVIRINDYVLTPLLGVFPPLGNSTIHIYIAKILAFIFVICLISAIGWATKILVINRFFVWGESVFVRIPIMGRIYNVIKQIATAFLGQDKTIFGKVVMVEYPREGIFSIGFTTGDTRGEAQNRVKEPAINIFIPTTPNPTSGMYIMVPKRSVTFLDMSVEDGMKLIISGGSFTPDEVRRGGERMGHKK